MNLILKNLLKLQSLEFEKRPGKDALPLITELRGKIPEPILGHYDRLLARGKKGIVLVENQTCTGCHMRLPTGVIHTLMSGQDVQLCDTCGRYLCLPETNPAPPQPDPAKPPRKPRRAKKALQTV